MRQRKIKNLEEKYSRYEDRLVFNPAESRGCWRDVAREKGFDGATIRLEIGCGKGDFITETASRNPELFFVAIEGNRSVLLRALEKSEKSGLRNVAFIPAFVDNLCDWFNQGELSTIYLNFSDPWPKSNNAKRRLTHRVKLKQYFRILGTDGTLEFKTDNRDFFVFTIDEIRATDLIIKDLTRDLHNSEQQADSVETEYERKFSARGHKINRVVIARKDEEASSMTESKVNNLASFNGRTIPLEDKIFGISSRAKKATAEFGENKVVNATIGALLDDEGKLIVLSSIDKAMRSLEPSGYAEYAPISGTPGFKAAIVKAALGNHKTDRSIGVVATPGGTGAIRNTISNYSSPGDKILTHDWHWTPYRTIADEQGRRLETFEMFDDDGKFGVSDFAYKVKKLLRNQDSITIILNTPANNPTGYSLSVDDWKAVRDVLNNVDKDKKVALFVDVAYIDFAGESDETRKFYPILEELDENILPIIGYSTSKTFTFYGMRSGAMICLAKSSEVASEFELVNSYSARASWSNSPRAPQAVIEKIYADEKQLEEVDEERKVFRDMLAARGKAFEEEAAKIGLVTVPFRAGFFISVPCENSDEVGAKLEKENVFLVPMAKGLRISVASISEKKCREIPAIIKEKMSK